MQKLDILLLETNYPQWWSAHLLKCLDLSVSILLCVDIFLYFTCLLGFKTTSPFSGFPACRSAANTQTDKWPVSAGTGATSVDSVTLVTVSCTVSFLALTLAPFVAASRALGFSWITLIKKKKKKAVDVLSQVTLSLTGRHMKRAGDGFVLLLAVCFYTQQEVPAPPIPWIC